MYGKFSYFCGMKLNKEQIQALSGESGKFCLDIAKLIFGGLILASIVKKDLDSHILIGVGTFCVVLFIFVGLAFIVVSKKDKNQTGRNKKRYVKHNNFKRKETVQ